MWKKERMENKISVLITIIILLSFFPINNFSKADAPLEDPPPSYRFGNWGETEPFDVTVTEDENAITVTNAGGFSWKFFKGTSEYNEIWLNDSILVGDERWYLEYRQNPNTWKVRGEPYDVSYEQYEENQVIVTRQYTDYEGTDFNMTFNFFNKDRVKISFIGDIGQSDEYRICWQATGINTEYMEHNSGNKQTKIWNDGSMDMVFDYSDVYGIFGNITEVETEQQAHNHKVNHYFYVGELEEGAFNLDPSFGYTGDDSEEPILAGINEFTLGAYAVSPNNGIADNITVKWSFLSVPNAGNDIILGCALYEYVDYSSDYAGVLVGSTALREIQDTRDNLEDIFVFEDPKPTLTKGVNYYLVIMSMESTSGLDGWRIKTTAAGTHGFKRSGFGSWENPLTGEAEFGEDIYIYCSYTKTNEGPLFSNEEPLNNSYNKSISTIRVNATITDAEGNLSTVDWYTSTDAVSWTHKQTNLTILNESVSYDYTVTEYQTIYYWKITANDSEYNETAIYEFVTTPYRTTYFNDTFPYENWIETNHYLTHETGWENFTYTISDTYVQDPSFTFVAATENINPNLDMYDSDYDYGPSPRTVFIDNDTGYSVGMDTSGADEAHIYKTVDGGATWSDEGGIDLATDPTDGWAGAVWYDQWTAGDTTGTKIYIAMIGDDYDDVEFNYIDTSDDSTRGSWNAVYSWASGADGSDGSPAICKGTDDILWLGGFGYNTGVLYNSSDGGDTWVDSTPGTLFDDDVDDMQLLPLPDGDIMCVYFDSTIADLGYFIYTQSTNSWSSWTKIDDGDIGGWIGWSCSMDYSSGDIYVALNNDVVSATGDVQFWIYSIGNSTWWGDINIVTDKYGYHPGVVVSQGTGEIFVFYTQGSFGVLDIYYTSSTDGGRSWGGKAVKVNTVTDDNRYCLGNFMSYHRIYATWVNQDLDDWHGNTLERYVDGPPADGWIRGKEIFKPVAGTWDKFYADVNSTLHSGFALSDNSTDYNITSGLVGDGDDISSLTNNSLYIFGNFSSSPVNMASWNITWTIPSAPIQSGEVPANGSSGIGLTPDLFVLCTDADADDMNATWWSNSSGSWLQFASNWTSFANNTNITQSFTNASAYSTTYWWSVNLTDDTYWTNETYHFTTEAAPNSAPIQSGEVPTNGSSGIGLTPDLFVLCTDNDNDNLNATWWSNSSGTWLQFASNSTANGFANNTNITQSFTNASAHSTTYWWSLNLSDGTFWTNKTYHFTIAAPTISVNITPTSHPFGFMSITEEQSTTDGYFNITNTGDVDINIYIEGVNATNSTCGVNWTLDVSVGADQYRMQYKTASTWKNITLSAADPDALVVSNLSPGDFQLIDIKILTPTETTCYEEMTLSFTVSAVQS